MQKAIIADLDGTLFNSKRNISEFTRETLRTCRKSGMLIVIATARPLRTVMRRIPPDVHDDYLVLCNGAWVVRNREVIQRNELSAELVMSTLAALHRMGYAPAIEANDCFYTDGEPDPGFIGSSFPLDSYPMIPACKVLAYAKEGINPERVKQALPRDVSYVITDSKTLLQVGAPKCSKLSACVRILRSAGIALEDTYAFGDDNIDISVFEAVGCGIAMTNATPELRAIATHITATNDEDGVARGILKHVLSS